MEKSKLKKTIHAIHSVKGGCGKSYFSFALATNLIPRSEKINQFSSQQKSVLLIDSDLKGTSLETLFGEVENNRASIRLENQNKKYFNELIFSNYINLEEDVSTCIITLNDEELNIATPQERNFDIIFSSSDFEKKKKFLYSKNERSFEKISVEQFKYCFESFMTSIIDWERGYQDFIFDLSPTSDEYTESMLDVFLDLSNRKNVEFHHYLVTTDDLAHVDATVKYIDYISQLSFRTENHRKITIVINQNYSQDVFWYLYNDGKDNKEEMRLGIVQKIKEKLRSKGINQEKIDEIDFLYADFNEYFFRFTHIFSLDTNLKFGGFILYKYDNISNKFEIL